jgi:hypothetical protein
MGFCDAPVWDTLGELLPRLSQLELYIVDQLSDGRYSWGYSRRGRYGYYDRSGGQETSDVENGRYAHCGKSWAELLAASPSGFANLTRLSLLGTRRDFVKCAQLAEHLPNLVDLALTTSCVDLGTVDTPAGPSFTFPKLINLALYGRCSAGAILDYLRPAAPHVIHITLRDEGGTHQIVKSLDSWKALEGLALYGSPAGDLLSEMVYFQNQENRAKFGSLTMLLLEQTWNRWSSWGNTCSFGRSYLMLIDPVSHSTQIPHQPS